jgi:platelet-activating factor acetylhydrolase IB subunit alpha
MSSMYRCKLTQHREVAIFEYLKLRGYNESVESFAKESMAGISTSETSNGELNKSKISHLEKKWNILSIQQKKLLEAESKAEKLMEELDGYKSGDVYRKQKQELRSALVPTKPCKFELTGHRDTITCVNFHPKYSILASSSEDASIRLWDYESGEFEKALRGHTASVNYVSFDSEGKWLGKDYDQAFSKN